MKKIILIVDDNSANLYLLKNLLESEGMEVIGAQNGKEALEKAQAHPPDIIISDILMPVMDGYTFCREVKADKRLQDIPFIFYTATYTEKKDETFALSLGADSFIIKPQEPDVLVGLLSKFFSGERQAKPIATKPLGEEMEFFRKHNEILFRKLEKKMFALEIANQQLKILEERYRLSFENVSDVIIVINKNLQVVNMSPSVEIILGYKPGEFIGRPFAELDKILTPESFNRAVSNAAAVLKGETIASTNYEFVAYDGTIKIGEVSGSPIYDEGQIVGMIAVARDATQKMEFEKALAESEKKYRDILHNMDDAYFEVDLQGNFMFFNDAMLLITERSREELMGLNYRQYMTPETAKGVSEVFFQVYKTGKPVRLFTYEIITKSGRKKYFESWVDILLDENKKPVGFRGISRDITARKKAEDERDQIFSKLRKALGAIISAMAATVEIRDPYTSGHQRRVADLARAIATEMRLDRDQIEGIRMAASIHDLGKVSIPSEILSMPRQLTKLEFDLIKTHSQAGYDILKDIEFPWPIARIILEHHERMNGSGYPQGLAGEKILLESRILAVADVVEAMSSHRPYRPGLGINKALEEIEQNRDILYEAGAVDACLKLFRENNYKFS